MSSALEYSNQSPDIRLMAEFGTSLPSIPMSLPWSGSPFDIANSTMILDIGLVGVIRLLYTMFKGGTRALLYSACLGMKF